MSVEKENPNDPLFRMIWGDVIILQLSVIAPRLSPNLSPLEILETHFALFEILRGGKFWVKEMDAFEISNFIEIESSYPHELEKLSSNGAKLEFRETSDDDIFCKKYLQRQ